MDACGAVDKRLRSPESLCGTAATGLGPRRWWGTSGRLGSGHEATSPGLDVSAGAPADRPVDVPGTRGRGGRAGSAGPGRGGDRAGDGGRRGAGDGDDE